MDSSSSLHHQPITACRALIRQNTFIDAMVAGCCTEELTLNVSVHRVWKAAACEDHILLPKIMPQYFSGAELIGDGEAGSTKIFHFDPAMKPLIFVKNHVEVLDHGSHTLKYKTVEGGHLGHTLKSHTIEHKYDALSADTCSLKIKVEYDTIDDKGLPEEEVNKIKEGSVWVAKAVEGYLTTNPAAYA
ncbi:phytohormone-binding protein-like [Musa acuminata AAA Group]|uniref:phytohormone-binding protein-like n=1 Tax=Musa acuminata AAA Group TaxID=214697 RepID=UPI0031E3A56D